MHSFYIIHVDLKAGHVDHLLSYIIIMKDYL